MRGPRCERCPEGARARETVQGMRVCSKCARVLRGEATDMLAQLPEDSQ